VLVIVSLKGNIMNKIKKFEKFLESLKGKGQDGLIESVIQGFRACMETVLPREAEVYTDEYDEGYTEDYVKYLGGSETDDDDEFDEEEHIYNYDPPEKDPDVTVDIDAGKGIEQSPTAQKKSEHDYWKEDRKLDMKGADRSWKKFRKHQHKDPKLESISGDPDLEHTIGDYYYDRKEGKYYDKARDMYVESSEVQDRLYNQQLMVNINNDVLKRVLKLGLINGNEYLRNHSRVTWDETFSNELHRRAKEKGISIMELFMEEKQKY